MAVKIFLDTEFTGLHQNTTLISLALVAETGEEFYAEFNDYDTTQVFEWLESHVMDKLEFKNHETFILQEDKSFKFKDNKHAIRIVLEKWLAQFDSIEIWADVLAYDWVLFCELFGGARSVPQQIFYAPFDLSTIFRWHHRINPISNYQNDINRCEFIELPNALQHHALHDARVEKMCYEKLRLL